MSKIHSTAIVSPKAELDSTVEVGPYAIIGPNVKIGARTVIGAHVTVDGITTLGEENKIYPHAALGGPPQDKKYRGEPTALVIGDRNTIRESCTFNTGTVQDEGVTRVGDDNWVMCYAHVAHDCRIGNQIVLANSVQVAGHVHIGDWAILGGTAAVHQYCRIGAHAIIGGAIAVRQDIPPYITVAGYPPGPKGVNTEGLSRRGFSAEAIAAIKRAYRVVYRSGLNLEEALVALDQQAATELEGAEAVRQFAQFLRDSTRGILR